MRRCFVPLERPFLFSVASFVVLQRSYWEKKDKDNLLLPGSVTFVHKHSFLSSVRPSVLPPWLKRQGKSLQYTVVCGSFHRMSRADRDVKLLRILPLQRCFPSHWLHGRQQSLLLSRPQQLEPSPEFNRNVWWYLARTTWSWLGFLFYFYFFLFLKKLSSKYSNDPKVSGLPDPC